MGSLVEDGGLAGQVCPCDCGPGHQADEGVACRRGWSGRQRQGGGALRTASGQGRVGGRQL